MRLSFSRGTVLILLLVMVVGLAGCGVGPDAEQLRQQQAEAFDRDLSRLLASVDVLNNQQMLEGEVDPELNSLLAERVIDQWETMKSRARNLLTESQYNELVSAIDPLKPVAEGSGDRLKVAHLKAIQSTVEELLLRDVDDELRSVVLAVKRADGEIRVEKQRLKQRIGVALLPARPLYRGAEMVSPAEDGQKQLRVILRESRTKREISGSELTARFLDGNGETLEEVELNETWGPYLFYGENVTLPEATEQLAITVEPSNLGRHASQKQISARRYTVRFAASWVDGIWTMDGERPRPVDPDYTIGSDIEHALEEPLASETAGPYWAGFIAEHAEPYWIPHDHGAEAHMHAAEIPDNANRHLELALLDKDTNRTVPHANVQLRLESEGRAPIETQLPYLMAEFNHYGHSLYVPAGEYRVVARIGRPQLLTLTPERFPSEVTASYSWTADDES